MKKKVAILFGGRSPEHNISLLSARSVIDNLDQLLYEKVLIGIDKNGIWSYFGSKINFINEGDAINVALPKNGVTVYFSQNVGENCLVSKKNGSIVAKIDVVFPVLHGLHGEDGSVQGLMKLSGLPCVGCDLLGSSICMDKDVAKRLLRDSGIGIADFVTLRENYKNNMSYDEIVKKLGHQLYIKPANLGSSVGVSFVDNKADFEKALNLAFRYDKKVVIEEKITGREIECAVLGNENPEASAIGEVAPTSAFYTFESKYVDKTDAQLSIPAKITEAEAKAAKDLAVKAFIALECSGFSRVDMFLKEDGDIIVNEINTIPGFTSISMYPKLWEYSGTPYKKLLSCLIDLAYQYNIKS